MKHFLIGIVTWPLAVLLFVIFLVVSLVLIVCALLSLLMWPLLVVYLEDRRTEKKKS